MGSLVGQTEANVRQALRIVDAMAPCVAVHRRGREGARRRRLQRPGRLRRLGPAVRHAAVAGSNDHEQRRLRRRHGQRHLASCRRSSAGPSGSTPFLPRPARARRRRRRSGGCTSAGSASTRRSGGPATRDWTGAEMQGVLPAGGAARRPADRGGAEHRAGGGHGRRVGRAAADLGQRPLPGRRPPRHLLPRRHRRPRSPAATSGEATRRPTDRHRHDRHQTAAIPRRSLHRGGGPSRPVASSPSPEAR